MGKNGQLREVCWLPLMWLQFYIQYFFCQFGKKPLQELIKIHY